MSARAQRTLFDLTQDGLGIGQKFCISQRKLKPRARADYAKSLVPLSSLKQYYNGRACLGWHHFELEVNGDVLGSFDFEAIAPDDQRSAGNR